MRRFCENVTTLEVQGDLVWKAYSNISSIIQKRAIDLFSVGRLIAADARLLETLFTGTFTLVHLMSSTEDFV